MKQRLKTFACVAALGIALGAISAQAAPVSTLISFGPNVLSDDNRESIVNNAGAADVIDVGDVLRGVVTFNQLFNSQVGPGGALLGGSSGNDELTGLFEIRVASKTPSGTPGIFNYTFEPLTSSGVMARMWTGAPNIQLDLTTQATSEATATDGSLWWELGFTGAVSGNTRLAAAGQGWAATGPDTLAALNAGSQVGFSNFGVSRTSSSGIAGGLPLIPLDSFFGTGAEIVGTSTTRGTVGLPPTPWQLSSDTTIQFNVIPLPQAAWTGISMLVALGAIGAARRHAGNRRQLV
jgi:hypothetical protein